MRPSFVTLVRWGSNFKDLRLTHETPSEQKALILQIAAVTALPRTGCALSGVLICTISLCHSWLTYPNDPSFLLLVSLAYHLIYCNYILSVYSSSDISHPSGSQYLSSSLAIIFGNFDFCATRHPISWILLLTCLISTEIVIHSTSSSTLMDTLKTFLWVMTITSKS